MGRIITDEARAVLEKEFKALKKDVFINIYTKKGLNDQFNDYTLQVCREIAEISKKIHIQPIKELPPDIGIDTSPVLIFNPQTHRIRFLGAPAGEEGRSLIGTIIMLSSDKGILSEDSIRRIKELDKEIDIMIFVSPTCPYCPQQVLYAISVAIVNPERIKVTVVEIYENRDLAEKYSVRSVPQTVINGNIVSTGLQPEEVFVDSLFTGVPVEYRVAPSKKKVIKKDLLVVGAGPAGLTAAIYAERAGLDTVVIEKANIGGQVTLTPVVENYPGFVRIPGKTLVDMMAQQALQYAEIYQGEEVIDIKRTKKGYFNVTTTNNKYRVRAVILATGAEHKKLGVPGEETFYGRGVSYCATCDGFFFKDGKKVVVVGGGNTAATEALYLDSIGAKVTLIHRREVLRAEKRLQESLKQRKIPILYNTIVLEIMGETAVNAVRLKNTKEDREFIMDVDGVFIAIGFAPANEIAKKIGLELTEDGYIKVDERMRTSHPGIYAAGDITGGVKQIVTAVSQGARAAISVFEDLQNPYWKEKGDMF